MKYVLPMGQFVVQLFFTSGKAVQLTWYEFSTYLHQLQSPM